MMAGGAKANKKQIYWLTNQCILKRQFIMAYKSKC